MKNRIDFDSVSNFHVTAHVDSDAGPWETRLPKPELRCQKWFMVIDPGPDGLRHIKAVLMLRKNRLREIHRTWHQIATEWYGIELCSTYNWRTIRRVRIDESVRRLRVPLVQLSRREWVALFGTWDFQTIIAERPTPRIRL